MKIEPVKLTLNEAWEWARARQFPGVPASGESLCYEDRSRATCHVLRNRFGRFFLYRQTGVMLRDGGYYKGREGGVTQVFLSFPGSPFPFEGLHSANRYMADGRYIRRADCLGDTAFDLVEAASASEISEYLRDHEGWPTRDDYVKTGSLVGQQLLPNGMLHSPNANSRLALLDSLIHASGDEVFERCRWAYEEADKVSEQGRSVRVFRTSDDYERSARWGLWGRLAAAVPILVVGCAGFETPAAGMVFLGFGAIYVTCVESVIRKAQGALTAKFRYVD